MFLLLFYWIFFFKGRSIVVDWAIPKNKYETIHTSQKNEENNSVKEEAGVDAIKEEEAEIKEEIFSDDQDDTEEPSKTVEDYLSLDTTKVENENLVDFEAEDFKCVFSLYIYF